MGLLLSLSKVAVDPFVRTTEALPSVKGGRYQARAEDIISLLSCSDFALARVRVGLAGF